MAQIGRERTVSRKFRPDPGLSVPRVSQSSRFSIDLPRRRIPPTVFRKPAQSFRSYLTRSEILCLLYPTRNSVDCSHSRLLIRPGDLRLVHLPTVLLVD